MRLNSFCTFATQWRSRIKELLLQLTTLAAILILLLLILSLVAATLCAMVLSLLVWAMSRTGYVLKRTTHK